MTQAFFAELLEKQFVYQADRQRGKFRAFLLTAFKHFIANQWRQSRALKRGGGRQHYDLDFQSADALFEFASGTSLTAEQIYDRQWAISLLDRILSQLRAEWARDGDEELFDCVKGYLTADRPPHTYTELAARFGISSGGLKMRVHRLRGRYRELLREQIADTVAGHAELDEEIRWLFNVLRG